MTFSRRASGALVALLGCGAVGGAWSEDSDVGALKLMVQELSQKLKETNEELKAVKLKTQPIGASSPQQAAENKYGPQATVQTGQGKLHIGGLIQVWYSSIQNDSNGLLGKTNADFNKQGDNDSFSIRRAELSFTMAIHENVTGYIMADYAGGFARPGLFGPPYNGGFFKTGPSNPSAGGSGSGLNLQDVLIHYHGVVPHHDFSVGQFLPTFSMEDYGPNGMLDFVERSWVGNHYPRDLGVNVHGSWWDNGGGGAYLGGGDNGRIQYWLTLFDGKQNFHTGNTQNGADDNDAKDFLGTVLVRPVWKNETWGSLELAYSYGHGFHGESGSAANGGLGQSETDAYRHSGWIEYRPGGPVKGWWLKGEYAKVKDRQSPGVVTFPVSQTHPRAFGAQAWEVSTGYRLDNSTFACDIPKCLKGLEFAYRFQQFQNVYMADRVYPVRTDVFSHTMQTAGINYYIKGHNAKIQLNYNWLGEPSSGKFHFRGVRNDSLMAAWQVMW